MSLLSNNPPAKTINFVHANGFPAQSYNKVFAHLPSEYKVIALNKYAHNINYPLNENWENQILEMIEFVEQNRIEDEKVVAIGHSFGAVVSYMCVCRRPDLFSSLIMLDPPLITGLARHLVRFAKRSWLIDKVTPAGITQGRNRKWHREQDLHTYFSNKNLFNDFDPDCIQDYIDSGTEEKGEHRHLSFNVETEAHIFRTIPHNLQKYTGQLKVATCIITGKGTDVCVPSLLRPFLKANPSIKHIVFEKGKHMFPLEYPIEVAGLITKVLSKT